MNKEIDVDWSNFRDGWASGSMICERCSKVFNSVRFLYSCHDKVKGDWPECCGRLAGFMNDWEPEIKKAEYYSSHEVHLEVSKENKMLDKFREYAKKLYKKHTTIDDNVNAEVEDFYSDECPPHLVWDRARASTYKEIAQELMDLCERE